MKVEERLEIPSCPVCGESHAYKLDIERTYVVETLTADNLRERSQPIKFTRIFVCPLENRKFQASFELHQTPSSNIKSVTIGGVVKDEE